MRARVAPLVLLAALALSVATVAPAWGAVAQPCGGVAQINDPSGDGHHASSDVLGAWFSEEAGRLQAVIKVKAGSWEPEHEDAEQNGAGYAMVFSLGGKAVYVRARSWPHSEKPVEFDYGTYASGSWFSSLGPTSGEVTPAAFGGSVAIDVPAALGAVAGTRLASPYVLTYDGITAGVPDWVDQAPGGPPPTGSARGADYVVGSCAAADPSQAGVVAVRLAAPKRVVGARRVTVAGSVVPAQAGVAVELTARGRTRTVRSLVTDSSGRFRVGLLIGEKTELRAVAAGVGSQTVTVAVRSKVRLELRRQRSGALRLGGRLEPVLPGRLLLLRAGEFRPSLAKPASGERFSWRLAAGSLPPGRYQVVYVPRAGLAARSTSNAVRVR